MRDIAIVWRYLGEISLSVEGINCGILLLLGDSKSGISLSFGDNKCGISLLFGGRC